MSLRAAISFFLLLCFAMSAKAQKNDTIYLKNGDRLTGELKKFEYGQLTLSTEAMQKVYIDFERINTIYSKKYFEIRTSSGYRYFGFFLNSPNVAEVLIVAGNDTIEKAMWDVVLIMPIRSSFLQKIDGSLDLGLSYTKASDVFQFSLNGYISHRTNNYATRLDIKNIITNDGDGVSSRNRDYGLNVTRYSKNKWFVMGQVKTQENTELDLDSRIQAGVGGGSDFIRTNTNRLYWIAGLLVNREAAISTDDVSVNVESAFTIQYKWFQYHRPKIDVSTNINVFPSLTISGRVRMEYYLYAKYEVIKDFFLGVQFYDNYDNKPTSGESAKNDYGIITTIGWSF